MQGPVHNLAVLVFCLGLTMCTGCAETAERFTSFGSRLMFRTPEQVLNIKTPADRIKELKKLAKAAPKQPPAEQEKMVATLSAEYQNESDPILRRQLLRTLAVYPQTAAGAVVLGAVSDGDVETRRTACACLGIRGDKGAVTELTRLIGSETNFDVRIAAVRALGQTGDPSALLPLSEAIIDPDPAMQARAHESLVSVSGRDYGNDVQAWRQYAQTGKSDAPEVSLAERVRRTLF
jgi:HEAT repeat protein